MRRAKAGQRELSITTGEMTTTTSPTWLLDHAGSWVYQVCVRVSKSWWRWLATAVSGGFFLYLPTGKYITYVWKYLGRSSPRTQR